VAEARPTASAALPFLADPFPAETFPACDLLTPIGPVDIPHFLWKLSLRAGEIRAPDKRRLCAWRGDISPRGICFSVSTEKADPSVALGRKAPSRFLVMTILGSNTLRRG